MATKQSQAEKLEAALLTEQAALRDLEAQAASKGAAILALEEMAAADLAAVPVGDLERESRKQAGARLEAEALRIEKRELDRRIEGQAAKIAGARKELRDEQARALRVMGGDELTAITAEARTLLERITVFAGLDTQHRNLTTAQFGHSSFAGSPLPGSSAVLGLKEQLLGFLGSERLRAKQAAQVAIVSGGK